MNPSLRSQHRRAVAKIDPQPGFALVSTLIVLSLLLLVALATVRFSQHETRKSYRDTAQATAKANAKLALQVAISQLQLYTGRDQTTTCRADLLDTRVGPSSKNDPTILHPHYTLAFQTTPADSNYNHTTYGSGVFLRTAKALPACLVSGNEFFNLLNNELETYPEGYTTALTVLQDEQAVEISPSIRVPTVDVPANGNVSGRYAYWVSDENLKARVNLPSYSENAHDSGSAEHSNLLRSSPSLGVKIADSFEGLNSPEKHHSLSSLALLPELDQKDLKELQHDLTAHSQSVLCDLKHGGLKRNLTAALNSSDSEFQQLLQHKAEGAEADCPTFLFQKWSFPAEQETLSYSHYPGAPWELFRSYLRRAEFEPQLNGKEPIILSHLGSAAHKLPHYWQHNASNKNGPYFLDARLVRRSPVLLRFQLSIDYSIQYLGTSEDPELGGTCHNFELRQHFIPKVSFWNPYNADLDVSEKIEYHIYLDRSWSTGRHNTHFRAHFPAGTPWKIQSLHQDKKKEAISWSPPLVGAQEFHYPFHPDGNTASGSTLARLSFHIPPFLLSAGATATFSNGASHEFLKFKKSHSNTLTLQTSNSSSGYSFYTNNAQIRVPASTTPNYLDAIPELELLTYPSYKGSTHTRLHVTNASSFQRIQWNFADITSNARIRFLPTFSNNSTPLPESDANGTESPKFSAVAIRKFPDIDHFSVAAEDSNAYSAPWNIFYQHNASRYSAYGTNSLSGNTFSSPPQYFTGLLLGNDPLLHPDITPDAECYVGHSDRAATGKLKAIQIALPRSALRTFSPAHFSQINLAKWLSNYNAEQSNASATDALSPSFSIGNSFCSPHIPPSRSALHIIDNLAYQSSNSSTQYDSSFRYNEALWDRFFLTGEQPNNITTTQEIHTERQAKHLTPAQDIDLETWNSTQESATKLTLTGGFNINSTSVKAWKLLLASSVQPDKTVPFPRLQHTDSESYQTPPIDPSSPRLYDGSQHRALSATEIENLAHHIVAQNKLRGPYCSLAQFINRSLSPEHHFRKSALNQPLSSDDVCYEGALQSAINKAKINGAFHQNTANIPTSLQADETNIADFQEGKVNPKAFKYHTGYGAPGTLTQSDILNHIGHRLTARSDTFKIRAYGDATDSQGKITAKAYCEAIVQRFPEYMNTKDSAETPPQVWELQQTGDQLPTQGTFSPNPKLSQLSQHLGRRYKIVSFRWLHPNEI